MRGTSRPCLRRRALLAVVLVALCARPAAGDGGLRNGPWLLEPSHDAVTVMVERLTPGPVRVLARADGAAVADALTARSDAATTLHALRLTGLRAGTRYRYEVTGPGIAPGQGGAFLAAPARDDALRFVVYGDTRSDAAEHATIVRAIERDAPAFVLHTGDLVSDGRRDALWQQFFAIEHDLLRDAPLVPVIGNHEIQAGGAPGFANFRRYVHVGPPEPGEPAPDPRVDYTVAFGGVRLVLVNAYSDWASAAMRDWLANRIDAAHRDDPAAFVLVAMHWGPCSSGPHGENHALRAAHVDALMREHHVDLVVSGHDHFYERGDDAGLPYLVTGGGAAELYRHRRVHAYERAFASEHHYVRADVEPGRIVFTAVRADGSVIDRCPLTHAGWRCDDAPDAGVRAAGPVARPRAARAPRPARAADCHYAPWARGGVVALGLLAVLALWRRLSRPAPRASRRRSRS